MEEEGAKSERVRSRWSPKPEQILILESFFNSGMVNPSKDETVRVRKLLQKFGTVGDANVFYWFQNRRSRSRRRQRQIMHQPAAIDCPQYPHVLGVGAIQHDHDRAHVNLVATDTPTSNMPFASSSSSAAAAVGDGQHGVNGFFSLSSPQMGFPENIDHTSHASSVFYPTLDPNFSYQAGYGGTNISGLILVFINGIATELPKGPIDIKTLFGEDKMLVHSSEVPIPTNEFGFLMQNLQHGESYFLVSKPTHGMNTSA